MPRTSRRWEPNAIHHAVARAHCGRPVFAPDEERGFLVRRAVRAFRETDATCLGWAVLANHYHVLVRCPGPPGPTFARLNTSLARRASGRRGDRGAVFQNRFYSDPCEDEGSLLGRIVYVLGNPLHHRVVPTVAALCVHPWSGLGEVLGLREPRWTNVAAVLEMIDSDPSRARRALLEALEAKAVEWAADGGDPAEDRGLERSRGVRRAAADSDACAATGVHPSRLHPVGARGPADPTSPSVASPLVDGWISQGLVPVACGLAGADPARVAAGERARRESDARAIVAHVACEIAGCSAAETAPWIGIAPSAVACAGRRGGEILARLGQDPVALLGLSRRPS